MTTVFKQESNIGTVQIKVNKDNLLKALTIVLGAISSRATLPILNNILIQTNGPDQILITATDLELTIKTKCEASVALQGSVTIPAKKFYEVIRELPPGEIEVTVAKNNAVNIKTNRSFFKIMGLEADDFPKPPTPSTEQPLELDEKILKRCFNLTSFAVSRDETRHALNGALMILKPKTARKKYHGRPK